MKLTETIQKLKAYPDVMEFNPPVSKKEIHDFEIANEIILPTSYTEILQHFDGGELFIPGTVIYGISHGKTIKEANSRNVRKDFQIPNSMLIIGKVNYGDYICIDLNTSEIMQWDHENDEEFCRWNTLNEYLMETIAAYKGGGF